MIPQTITEVNNFSEKTSTGSDFPTSLVSYRHISASILKTQVYQALVDAGESGKGESFKTCGEDVYTLQCESCGYEHKVTYNCKLRVCSHCAGVKMSGYIKKYLPYMKSLKFFSVRSVMLSIKNVEDLRAGVEKIRECFTKLRRRGYYESRIQGGLYGIEAKPGKDGKWNVHLHFLYYGSYIPQARLSDDWEDITGDSFYVWINRPASPRDALRYVLKYITKGVDLDAAGWTVERLVEFVVALSDVRLVQAFGCFLGEVARREPFACPECGYVLWRRVSPDGETVFSPLDRMLWNFRHNRSP